jgi:hypothetical protein
VPCIHSAAGLHRLERAFQARIKNKKEEHSNVKA